MSDLYERLEKEIRKQTETHKGDTVEMAGEQLIDMVRGDDAAAEILLTDLGNKEMTVEHAEKKIRAYADEQHKKNKGNCVGVSPKKAEEILRAFYGLPAPAESQAPAAAAIDPFAFL